jgi:hypothetical protein
MLGTSNTASLRRGVEENRPAVLFGNTFEQTTGVTSTLPHPS